MFTSIVFAPCLSAAQAPSYTVRVLNERGQPIADARVELSRRAQPTIQRTDSAGRAEFAASSTSAKGELMALSIQRVGFAAWADSISFDDAEPLVVRLERVKVTLDEVTVRATALERGSRLFGVDDRIRRGVPSASITRAAIDKRNPIALSQMLRGIAGLRLADSLGAMVAISTRGSKWERGQRLFVPCVMRISIDGVVMSSPVSIDHLPPIDVHAVEIYYGPARTPPEFAGIRTDAWCGLISIWTRAGGE
jgi:hypothetical protein